MSLFSDITARVFGSEIKKQVAAIAAKFAVAETEQTIMVGIDWNAVYRDRYSYQRKTIQDEVLKAWRLNPLAKRMVEWQREYITDGIEFDCEHEPTKKFLLEFWNHNLNRLDQQLPEWCDEVTLFGNLALYLNDDDAGMTYVRVYPTDLIAEINTRPGDVRQEVSYQPTDLELSAIPVFVPDGHGAGILHYAVNRLAGMSWGESDLAPLLPWLARYASWVEDRVRLNRFRTAFMYIVNGSYASEAARLAREKELRANPPTPGSIMVANVNGGESWNVLSANLDASDASHDGLMLKKFLAGGFGMPLHFLAEPESSTRTTATAAGEPTFKKLESRQKFFLDLIQAVLKAAVLRRFQRDGSVDPKVEIRVRASDISEKDNAALALASSQSVTAFGMLLDRNLITSEEYMRLVYRFAGESLPTERPSGDPVPLAPKGGNGFAPQDNAGMKVDPQSNEVKGEPQ
jgi:hypothetical protein